MIKTNRESLTEAFCNNPDDGVLRNVLIDLLQEEGDSAWEWLSWATKYGVHPMTRGRVINGTCDTWWCLTGRISHETYFRYWNSRDEERNYLPWDKDPGLVGDLFPKSPSGLSNTWRWFLDNASRRPFPEEYR